MRQRVSGSDHSWTRALRHAKRIGSVRTFALALWSDQVWLSQCPIITQIVICRTIHLSMQDKIESARANGPVLHLETGGPESTPTSSLAVGVRPCNAHALMANALAVWRRPSVVSSIRCGHIYTSHGSIQKRRMGPSDDPQSMGTLGRQPRSRLPNATG